MVRKADESAFKVELLVGKTVQVDEQNRYFFSGKIEEETVRRDTSSIKRAEQVYACGCRREGNEEA